MKRFTKIFIFILILTAMAAGGFFWLNKKYKNRLNREKEKLVQDVQQKIILEDLKEEASSEGNSSVSSATSPDSQNITEVPGKYLLAMPFYSQAPNGNWDAIHEEMCEEASLLNAGLFLENKKLSSSEYEKELLKLKDLGEKVVGTWVSTSIADTQKLANAYFGDIIKSKIINNPTVGQIQAEIAAGNPVIVPLAGREIGNPNYTPPGPIYHMLVVKGYDEKFFITNDVGTRKGNSYVFRKEIIMDKMHDWDAEDIHRGGKRVLVLYK